MIIGQLPTPLPHINTTITQVAWRVTYPENTMYYQLRNDDNQVLSHGNWQVPIDVIEAWLDDSVVTNALIAAQPWVVVPPPPPATPEPVIEEIP